MSFTWSWGGLCNPPGGTPQPYNPTCNVWGAGDTVTLNRIDDDLPYFCYPGYEIVDGRKVCYEPMVCNYPSYRSAIHSFQMPSTSGDPGTGGCVAPGCNSLVTVYYYVTLYGTGFYFCDALGNPAVDPIYGLSGLDCFPPGCGTQVITCDPFHLPCFNCVNGFSGFYGP